MGFLMGQLSVVGIVAFVGALCVRVCLLKLVRAGVLAYAFIVVIFIVHLDQTSFRKKICLLEICYALHLYTDYYFHALQVLYIQIEIFCHGKIRNCVATPLPTKNPRAVFLL